jgi:thioredoxin reductase
MSDVVENTLFHAPSDDTTVDVVVIGAGPAGLSAATALGRSRRQVVVVDSGEPRNATSPAVHNVLGADGISPYELRSRGRAEVESYGVQVLDGRVLSVRPDGRAGFAVELADGAVFDARRVIVATGVVDELPPVPGLAERWGRDVLHCPYCHGWEVRDRTVAVLGTSGFAAHQAQLFRQLTSDVTLLAHTGPSPTDDERRDLEARGIDRVDGEVVGLAVEQDRLVGVRLASGRLFRCDALVISVRSHARVEFLDGLDVETTAVTLNGTDLGTVIVTDSTGATSLPGLFVVGNAADLRAQVLPSAAAGLMTGALVNADLISEDVRQARGSRHALQ